MPWTRGREGQGEALDVELLAELGIDLPLPLELEDLARRERRERSDDGHGLPVRPTAKRQTA